MKDFKFFQKGTLVDSRMMEMESRATAAFNADTPEGHMYRRRLYHTDLDYYHRLRNPSNNNEMERYYYDRGLGDLTRQQIEDQERQERMIRRLSGAEHRDNHGNTEFVRFFNGGSRETKVNPKWWMKIKMFFQTISLYWDQIWGVFIFAATATISVGLVISKLLNIW